MKKVVAILMLSLITLIINAQVPGYVPTTGLVGWWPFSGNASDASANGNDGAVQGGTLLGSDRFLNPNSSYFVDGVNCPDAEGVLLPAAINNTGEYTISIWFKSTDSTKQFQNIFNSFPHNYIGASFNYLAANGTIVFVGNGAWVVPYIVSHTTYNLDQWHHLVIVKSLTSFKYYQDSGLVNTVLIDASFNVGSFTHINAGAITINGGPNCYESFKGNVDDIGIWSRVLTECEIGQLYSSSYLNATQNIDICQGDSVVVGTSVYNAMGSYTDSLLSINNCDSIVVTNINVRSNSFSILSPTICFGNSFSVGSSSYDSTGVYSDLLTAENGCDSVITTNLTVVDCSGIDENHMPMFSVFPNPTNGNLFIASKSDINNGQLEVLDILGRKSFTRIVDLPANVAYSMDISTLPNGIYIVKLGDEMVRVVKK